MYLGLRENKIVSSTCGARWWAACGGYDDASQRAWLLCNQVLVEELREWRETEMPKNGLFRAELILLVRRWIIWDWYRIALDSGGILFNGSGDQ